MPIKESHRLFNCLRCKRQVFICRSCDRGNVYCHSECSKLARRQSMKEAGCRYQQTRRGRQHNAARQRRYRHRKIKKVTHQGSHQKAGEPNLTPGKKPSRKGRPLSPYYYCDFCGKHKTDLFRLGFLGNHSKARRKVTMSQALGP